MFKFKDGDRVVRVRSSDVSVNKYGRAGMLGSVLGYHRNGQAGLSVQWDAGGVTHGAFDGYFQLAPVETPPAPFAVSSKTAPKKPIVPGSRHDQVLKHLLTGKTLTQGEGIVLGYGTRVAATVHDLRRRGHNIVTTMKEDLKGSPYAEYRLVTRGANGNRKAA